MYRASWTNGVFVQTFAPGMAGMALEKKVSVSTDVKGNSAPGRDGLW